MLITTEIKMTLGIKNAKRIINNYKLDKNLKPGDIITIPIELLSKSSNCNVNILCDYCGKSLTVPFKRYNKSIKISGKYACSSKDCSNQKIKDVCQIKYGVDNPFQSDYIKKKIKNNLNEKYGVDHPMHLDMVKEKIKETCLERYGVTSYTKTDEYKQRSIETNLDRYGVKYILQSNKVKEKAKKTNLEKYGVNHYSKTESYKNSIKKTNLERHGSENYVNIEKAKLTNIERYGVDNPSKSKKIVDKIKKTCINKYNSEYYFNSKDFKEKSRKKIKEVYGVYDINKSESYRIENYEIANDINYIKYLENNISIFKCDCGEIHEFEIKSDNYYNRKKFNIPLCTICNPIGDSKSIKEIDLYKFIRSIYKGKIIQSYRDTLEIDIYLPDLKIGFEFNGLYWHSELYKDNNYHINKKDYFKNKGIEIVYIWEDDWAHKQDILKSQIKNKIGIIDNKIYARKCIVKIVNKDDSIKFLNKNHIQGKDSSKVKLGLYFNNTIVGLMTFNKIEGRKTMINDEWNLSRFCNKLNTKIIGGASKLLKYFIEEYKPTRIISYADKDWSNGNLYYNLKFKLSYQTKPDYKYIINNKRVHKSKYRKSKLNTKLTENLYMKKSHILKIWDCGKMKFEFYL